MEVGASAFQLETLVTSSLLNSCVITQPGDIYTVELDKILRHYAFSDTRKVTSAGSIAFRDKVRSFVVYPEINLILAHVGRAIHSVNTETMTSMELTSIPNVTALVPHSGGFEPVYVRFPDMTHTEIIELSMRSLYYAPISTNPALLQRAISHSKRPCLSGSRHGLFDFIVMQEGSELSANTSMSLIVCKSKEPVTAFPIPVSSLSYQTSTVAFLDKSMQTARRNINPLDFVYSPANEHLSRFNIMLLDIGKTLNSYAWIGECLYFAHKDQINAKLKIMGMDIRKLMYLMTFTSMVHNAATMSPTSLDIVGGLKEQSLKHIGDLVLTTVVETPLTAEFTPDYPIFSLEKPTYVDSTMKKQLLHEVYLRLCAGEKMDRNFCNSYSSGTTMYSYDWDDCGHAAHEALRVDAVEKDKPVERIVRKLNLSFFDDRDMHNRIIKGLPSEQSLRDPSMSSIKSHGQMNKVDSKETYSSNTTIKAIAQHPRLCFNLLRDANNLRKGTSVFTGNIVDLDLPKKARTLTDSNVITSKGMELFFSVQALSKEAKNSLLRCPLKLLESDLAHLSESMARAVRSALQFHGEDAEPHDVEEIDHELIAQVRKNKYCGAYIPLPYILRVRINEETKPFTYIDTERCVEEFNPTVWNYYNVLYGKEQNNTFIGMNKLYRLVVGKDDLAPGSTKCLAMQHIISQEEPLTKMEEEQTEPVSVLYQDGAATVAGQKQTVQGLIPAFISGNSHIFGLTNMYFKRANCLPCDTSTFYIYTDASLVAIKRTSLYRQVRTQLLQLNSETCKEKNIEELLEFVEGKLEKTLIDRFDMSSRDWTLCWVLVGSLRLLQKNFWGAILAFINARMANPIQIVGIFLHGIPLECISLVKNVPSRRHQPAQTYLTGVDFGCYSSRIYHVLTDSQYKASADEEGRVRYSKDQSLFHMNSILDDFCRVMTALGVSQEQDYVVLPPELELVSLSKRLGIPCVPATDGDRMSRMDACLLYLKLVLDPCDSWNLDLHSALSKADSCHEETKNALVGKVAIFCSRLIDDIASPSDKGNNEQASAVSPSSSMRKSVKNPDVPGTIAKTYRVTKPAVVDQHNIFPLRVLFIMLLSRESFHISRHQQRQFLMLHPSNLSDKQTCFLFSAQYSNIFLSTVGLLVLGRFYDLAYLTLETYIGWTVHSVSGIEILGRDWSSWAAVGTGEKKKALPGSAGGIKTTKITNIDSIYPGLASGSSIEALVQSYKALQFESADISILCQYTKALLSILALSYLHVTKYAAHLTYRTMLFFIIGLKNFSINSFLCKNLSQLSMQAPEYCANILKLSIGKSDQDIFDVLLDVQADQADVFARPPTEETVARFASSISIKAIQKYLTKTEAKRNALYVNLLLQVIVSGAQYAMTLKNDTPSTLLDTVNTYTSDDAITFLMQHIDMFPLQDTAQHNGSAIMQNVTRTLAQLISTSSSFYGPYLLAYIKMNDVSTAINILYEKAFPGIGPVLGSVMATIDRGSLTSIQTPLSVKQAPSAAGQSFALDRAAFKQLILWCVTASHAPCKASSILQDPKFRDGTATFEELWDGTSTVESLNMYIKECCIAFLMSHSQSKGATGTSTVARLPGHPSRSPAALLCEVLLRLRVCNERGIISKPDFSYCLMSLLNNDNIGGCGAQQYMAKYLYKDVLCAIPPDYPLSFVMPFFVRALQYQVTEQSEVTVSLMDVDTKLARCKGAVDRYKKIRTEISSFTKCPKCNKLLDPSSVTKFAFKYVDNSLMCFHVECAE